MGGGAGAGGDRLPLPHMHMLRVTVVVMLVAALMPELRRPPQVPEVMVPAVVAQLISVVPAEATISFPAAVRVSVRVPPAVKFVRATQRPPLTLSPAEPSGTCR